MKGELITLELLDIEKHAQGYFELSQDEKMLEYVGNTVPEVIDETVKLLKLYQEVFTNWMIIDNKSSNVIGILRLSNPQVCNGLLEAVESQRLMSAYWRKGHMKEAKSFFYEHVFNTLGVDILYADVYEGNVNSIKSLEYYGYELIETNQGIFSKTGENCLVYIYALTKDNYDKTQKSR